MPPPPDPSTLKCPTLIQEHSNDLCRLTLNKQKCDFFFFGIPWYILWSNLVEYTDAKEKRDIHLKVC